MPMRDPGSVVVKNKCNTPIKKYRGYLDSFDKQVNKSDGRLILYPVVNLKIQKYTKIEHYSSPKSFKTKVMSLKPQNSEQIVAGVMNILSYRATENQEKLPRVRKSNQMSGPPAQK